MMMDYSCLIYKSKVENHKLNGIFGPTVNAFEDALQPT